MTTFPTSAAFALAACIMAGAPQLARAQAMPNPYGAPISTEAAKKAAAAALAEARKNGWTVYATVVDVGGAVAYVERIDGVQSGSAEVSLEKARTAVAFKRPTKAFEDVVLSGKVQYLKLPGGIPLEGGLPLVVDGKIVGAIGVSGGSSAQDGQCAKAGADAVSPPPAAK
jgi:glc operon protein GlcG